MNVHVRGIDRPGPPPFRGEGGHLVSLPLLRPSLVPLQALIPGSEMFPSPPGPVADRGSSLFI